MSVPRFTHDALPAYSFVPGRFPHPHSDPAGHHFGRDLPPPEPIQAEQWQSSHRYRLGIDLFNHGYYWEAHEAWEALWNTNGRRGPAATLLKCLIQLAVVGVKLRQGMIDAATAHARRAAELARALRREMGEERFMGLDIAALEHASEQLAANPPSGGDGPSAVAVVFGIRILPLAA